MLVATAIAMLALSMFGSMVLNTNRAREMNHEEALAGRAVANLLERMHDEDFFELFALYNDDPEDDPEGPGTAVGSRFDVDGLRTLPGMSSVGSVRFPARTDPEAPGRWKLQEDLEDRALGMPRDLNLDGVRDGADHGGDYVILPLEVQVQWASNSGRRSYRVYTMLSEMRL